MHIDYLNKQTSPITIGEKSVGELSKAMLGTGFQGRKLAESIETWTQMLAEKNLTIFLGLSGAMVPGGMRKIIAYLIKKRLIDCLVSTGANIFHDCHEALGRKHYIGSHLVDDGDLFKHGIDRMYDVFAREEEFRNADHLLADFASTLDLSKSYSSREFIHLLGKELAGKGGDRDSITVSAFEHRIPVFIPAICDSSIGIGLLVARRKGNPLIIDQIKDVDEVTQIVENSSKTGVIYIGGGVPKNFIQQTEVITSILGRNIGGHSYAIQYTVDAPHWGGLSGCTLDEAVSWGKISPAAKKVQVFVDATIALPIVVHALHERTKDLMRIRPEFDWDEDKLYMEYK